MAKPRLILINGQRDALERTLEQKLVKALFSPDATEITHITAQLEALANKQPALKLVSTNNASNAPLTQNASNAPLTPHSSL